MSLRSPEALNISRGSLRFTLGRAQIFSAEQTSGNAARAVELWLLTPPDASLSVLAQRLVGLGRLGIGRFSDFGQTEAEVWLVREVLGVPFDAYARSRRADAEPWDWSSRLELGLQLARLLEECELGGIFPGPMRPSELVIDPAGKLHIRADALVGSLLALPGLPEQYTPGKSLSPRWLPPEQASGADWDAAANRYVLGLVLYWLLSGVHAFAGLGLRHGLEEQRLRGAPPMPAEIAATLPHGLQGLVLRLLDPDPSERPSHASDIAARLSEFSRAANPAFVAPRGASPEPPEPPVPARAGFGGGVHLTQPLLSSDPHIHQAPTLHSAGIDEHPLQSERPAQVSVRALQERRRAVRRESPSAGAVNHAERREPGAPELTVEPEAAESPARVRESSVPPRGSGPWARRALGAAPILLGLAVAYFLLDQPPQQAPAGPVEVRARPALDSAHTTSSDCASCHGRQAAEWRRSVMAHSVKSPLFQGLEMLIQEQVGKDLDCPGGAGILRKAGDQGACRNPQTGHAITGSGGEHWCVNCHAPGENLSASVPPWNGTSLTSATRQPLKDLLPASAMEGISCAFCHQVAGPARPGNLRRGQYEGNPFWTSVEDGQRFSMRPEDARGLFGIANSGYFLDPGIFLAGGSGAFAEPPGFAAPGIASPAAELLGGVHHKIPPETKKYLQSSEFCGACHDVRLFGSDVLGSKQGEHFKRLRNAYSEWVDYSNRELSAGREPASCQDCHMSTFPGVCVPGVPAPAVGGVQQSALTRGCPPGTRFEPRPPGQFPEGRVASSSAGTSRTTPHYFSGVDVPLGGDFAEHLVDEGRLDAFGIPLGARARRDLLLGRTFRFELQGPSRSGSRLEVPVVIENIGGGHRVPAGFSQEREFWVHLKVTDAEGRIIYEVGRVDRSDEDLHDKEFLRVNVRDDLRDGRGRPLGLFGADIADGRDVPRWSPDPHLGGTEFRGRGLINFQNGFLRCVLCIGRIDEFGKCQPLPGQEATRALRFADGDYDIDTGECRSNLFGENALFETYFPIGALDASRGVAKGPDAIIDRRSAPPGVPIRYVYELDARGGPLKLEARLLFRAFPPFLIRAFAEYERLMSARGLRPSGPLVTLEALERLDVVEIAKVEVTLP